MNSPDFLIIGAQKSGTSWLHRQLRQHPDIFMPPDKDAPFFFNDHNETRGFLERFKNAPINSLKGDACASYFWTRNTGPYPKQFNRDISFSIRQHLGSEMNFIVMLRHPVQRSISAYLHHIVHGSLNSGCSIIDAPKELGLISMSRYSLHLRHWQEDYPANQLLILPAPDALNTASILSETNRFLSLRTHSHFQNNEEKVFEGLQRDFLDDGVWVALNDPTLIHDTKARNLPWTELKGKKFIRLIDRSELEVVQNELHEDINLYHELFPKSQTV